MLRNLLMAVILLSTTGVKSQYQFQNNYRSSQNSLYWKNHKPYDGYWQQDAYYQIQAELNDSTESIHGKMRLVYYNNSPKSLTEAYFHLYQNSTLKNGLTDKLYQLNKVPTVFGKYESNGLGTVVKNVVFNGKKTQHFIDYTIMGVKLPEPIEPGDSAVFEMEFITFFDRGSIRRRMKVFDHHGVKHFNGVHWYPRICAYDRKFTWETAQHLEKEFYGDFGCYDVTLTLPKHYIVEATGTLQNKEEALPAELRSKIDIIRFKNKPVGSEPSVVIRPSRETKTWHFHANNVHDFAWTADPTYRMSEYTWSGIKCVALAMESNAGRWQETAKYTASVIALYSNAFGKYEYPKIVVADAADGMEYPMLTLCGGTYPSHRSLIAHEVGHNWFMGMLGSNETYRAALDEGFTQYLTGFAMRHLKIEPYPEYRRVYAGYIYAAMDAKDVPLNTHSNEFGDAIRHGGGYGQAYYKSATMLHNLKYYLGDSIFFKAMQDYVSRWKIAHPYVEDFRNSIIQSSQTDLNKFFDQWFESKDFIDYGIKKVKRISDTAYRITIKRKGNLVMPVHLDVMVENKGKSKGQKPWKITQINIPNSYFNHPERSNTTVWHSWGKLNREYDLEIEVDPTERIKQILIDPSGEMADIYRPDNVWKGRTQWRFDLGNGNNPSYLGSYQGLWRPAVRYNQYNGWLIGAMLSGQYAERKNNFELMLLSAPFQQPNQDQVIQYQSQLLSGWFYWSTKLRTGGTYFAKAIAYNQRLFAKMGWKMNIQNHEFGMYGLHLQGLQGSRSREIIKGNNWNWSPAHFNEYAYRGYVNGISQWNNRSNISMNLFWNMQYQAFGKMGNIRLNTRMSSTWSETQFGFVNIEWKHQQPVGKTLIKSRIFSQLGGGNNPSAESALYAAAANPEQAFENRLMRDFSAIAYNPVYIMESYPPQREIAPQYLHYAGGLNLRGYNGRVLGFQSNDTTLAFFRGASGASVNLNWEYGNLFKGLFRNRFIKLNPYVFTDAGIIAIPLKEQHISPLLVDAGLGFEFKFYKLSRLITNNFAQQTKPISIRLDLPLFLNRTQTSKENPFSFRWMLGLNASF